mmetsp:Transcript_6381/g.9979  ORF Transcript_6381/g.9979 Transcript_6381/m.9979 type:complete len:366 (-) Transcript_6381:335-1432(-)
MFTLLPLEKQAKLTKREIGETPKPVHWYAMTGYAPSRGTQAIQIDDVALAALEQRVLQEFRMGQKAVKSTMIAIEVKGAADSEQLVTESELLRSFPFYQELKALKPKGLQILNCTTAVKSAYSKLASEQYTSFECFNPALKQRLEELKIVVEYMEEMFPENPDTVAAARRGLVAASKIGIVNPLYATKEPTTTQPTGEEDSKFFRKELEAQREGWNLTAKAYKSMAEHIHHVQDNAGDYLRHYDLDGNGVLDKKELKMAVDQDPVLAEFLGIDPSKPGEFDTIFAEIDKDGSGTINVEEFDEAVRQHKSEKKAKDTVNLTVGWLDVARPVNKQRVFQGKNSDEMKMPEINNIEEWKAFSSKSYDA